MLYAEIQDGHQKWWKNVFLAKTAIDCAYTLQPADQNFIQITLSHTVSEINVFMHFTQMSKMATKNGRKMIVASITSLDLNV